MNLLEIFEESIIVFKTNKMRTGLSILGIIIGIGSVITLMSLGQASQESVKQRIQSLGSNLLIIRAGSSQQGFLQGASGSNTTLTYDDATAIRESLRVNTINNVAAEYSSRSQLSYERNNTNAQVSSVAGDYFTLRNVELFMGSYFADETAEKIVVLGPTLAEDLFGNANPLGQNIRINGQAFRVVGVTKSKGASGGGGANFDET